MANPPFEKLTNARASDLNLPWKEVRKGGRNLYGLGMLKCLDACRPGGASAVIAPFGWVRGDLADEFRCTLVERVSELHVLAYQDRRLFGDPQQDTGLHFIRLKSRDEDRFRNMCFGFDEEGLGPVDLLCAGARIDDPPQGWRLRVGPLVWNRCRRILQADQDGAIPVAYGGNIRPDGSLDFSVSRYKDRQYVIASEVAPTAVTSSPAILIRRTMRGAPGRWKIDVSVIPDDTPVVVENHVILIEAPDCSVVGPVSESMREKLRDHMRLAGQSQYQFDGSASGTLRRDQTGKSRCGVRASRVFHIQ